MLSFFRRKRKQKEAQILQQLLDTLSAPSQDERPPSVCTPQQIASKLCVCSTCQKRPSCKLEQLIAASQDCDSKWISYCSYRVGGVRGSATFPDIYLKDFDAATKEL